jgi:hypothetical protein
MSVMQKIFSLKFYDMTPEEGQTQKEADEIALK